MDFGPYCKTSLDQRWPWLLTIGLTCVAIVCAVSAVLTFGVNVLFWDDWASVHFVEKYISGTLSFSDLVSQHNEHRPLVFRLVRLAFVRAGDWNVLHEMLFSIFLVVVLLAVLSYWMIRSHSIIGSGDCRGVMLVTALLLLSTAQWENFLWGHQTAWFLQNLTAVVALLLLVESSRSRVAFGGAVFCACISTYSQGGGLVLWPVGLALLALESLFASPEAERPAYRLPLWIAFSFAIIYSYLHGYVKPEHHPSLLFAAKHPLGFVKFVLAYLGSPMFPEFPGRLRWAVFAGLAGLVGIIACTMALLKKKGRCYETYRAAMPWILLGSYSLGNAVITGISRMGLTPDSPAHAAHSSRYISVSCYFWICLCVLASLCRSPGQSHVPESATRLSYQWPVRALALLMGALIIAGDWNSLRAMKDRRKKLEIGRDALLFRNDDNALLNLFPDKDLIYRERPFLESIKLGAFRHVPAMADYSIMKHNGPEIGCVEAWGDDLSGDRLSVDGTLQLSGWAADKTTKLTAKKVLVVRGNEIVGTGFVGDTRPDVSQKMGLKNTEAFGWKATIAGKRLGIGEAHLKVFAVMQDNEEIAEIGERNIAVVAEGRGMVHRQSVKDYRVRNSPFRDR
jgi:hypothetical protein